MAFSHAILILMLINLKMQKFRYEYVSAKTISEHLNIPVPTTVKVLKSLNAAGLTAAKEGAKGGVLLAKPISEMTLLDVFVAIEHEAPLFKAPLSLPVDNDQVARFKAATNQYLRQVENTMRDALRNVTLADICAH